MNNYSIVSAAITDKGNTKEINQDSILVKSGVFGNNKAGLFGVCDGLGGLSFGEVASKIAIEELERWWQEKLNVYIDCLDNSKIINSLKEVVNICNVKIMKYGKSINKKVGTTISVLLVINDRYFVVHIGDSRIYKLGNKLDQITEDHSYVAMRVRNGEMSKTEARNSNNKNLLLQCVGVKDVLDIYSISGNICGGESFILCSDGFYNTFEDIELYKNFRLKKNLPEGTLQNHLCKMVQLVKNRHERDNISVILVRFNKNQNKIRLFEKIFK